MSYWENRVDPQERNTAMACLAVAKANLQEAFDIEWGNLDAAKKAELTPWLNDGGRRCLALESSRTSLRDKAILSLQEVMDNLSTPGSLRLGLPSEVTRCLNEVPRALKAYSRISIQRNSLLKRRGVLITVLKQKGKSFLPMKRCRVP